MLSFFNISVIYTFKFQFKSYGPDVPHRKHFIVLLLYVSISILMQLSLVLNFYYFFYQLSEQLHSYNYFVHTIVFIYEIGGYIAVLSYYLFSVMAITCRIELLNDNLR